MKKFKQPSRSFNFYWRDRAKSFFRNLIKQGSFGDYWKLLQWQAWHGGIGARPSDPEVDLWSSRLSRDESKLNIFLRLPHGVWSYDNILHNWKGYLQSTAMSGIMRNNGNDFISMPFLRLYSLVFRRKPKGVVKRATLLLSISAVVSSPAWFLAILKVIVFEMIPMELKLRRNGNRGNESEKNFDASGSRGGWKVVFLLHSPIGKQ